MLGRNQILEAMQLGTVIIHPFKPANLGTNSYDVCLGEWYYREQVPFHTSVYYNVYDQMCVDRVWGQPQKAMPEKLYPQLKNINESDKVIIIQPGETILAHTQEFIGGRKSITTMMKARSSFGRSFVEVCKCAGLGDVGYFTRWTMEITNNSRFYTIPLVVGRRIAQMTFFDVGETIVEYADTGKYQTSVDIGELELSWKPEMMLPRLHLDRDLTRTSGS